MSSCVSFIRLYYESVKIHTKFSKKNPIVFQKKKKLWKLTCKFFLIFAENKRSFSPSGKYFFSIQSKSPVDCGVKMEKIFIRGELFIAVPTARGRRLIRVILYKNTVFFFFWSRLHEIGFDDNTRPEFFWPLLRLYTRGARIGRGRQNGILAFSCFSTIIRT